MEGEYFHHHSRYVGQQPIPPPCSDFLTPAADSLSKELFSLLQLEGVIDHREHGVPSPSSPTVSPSTPKNLDSQGKAHEGDMSVYAGTGGLLYGCLHIHLKALASGCSSSAGNYLANTTLTTAEDIVEIIARDGRLGGLSHPSASTSPISFFLGPVGLAALALVTEKLSGSKQQSGENTSNARRKLEIRNRKAILDSIFAVADNTDCPNEDNNIEDEMLLGRAGYLSVLALLRSFQIEPSRCDAAAKRVITSLVERGKRTALGAAQEEENQDHHHHHHHHELPHLLPLQYEWRRGRGKKELGAAHGLVGILQQMLLFSHTLAKTSEEMSLILQTTRVLMRYVVANQQHHHDHREEDEAEFYVRLPTTTTPEEGEDFMLHWCHGLPGLVPLALACYRITLDDTFLSFAKKCAEGIFRYGMLRKGRGLCHGVSGNAYCFLQLYKVCREERYLFYAREFARTGGLLPSPTTESENDPYRASVMSYVDPQRRVQGRPDRPHSLMEGRMGELCFLADLLLVPNLACFPGVEPLGGATLHPAWMAQPLLSPLFLPCRCGCACERVYRPIGSELSRRL